MTRLARSPLLALAVAIAVCWWATWCLSDIRPRPDACMPVPGIPAELLGYHGAGTPCRPEDTPWIAPHRPQDSPGEVPEGMDDLKDLLGSETLPGRAGCCMSDILRRQKATASYEELSRLRLSR